MVFGGQDPDAHVRCEISQQALNDHFGGDGKDKLPVFRANQKVIEESAREKYLAGQLEADGSILIRTFDLRTN